MLRFEWNALRAGDDVCVHDDRDPRAQLASGVVTMVTTVNGANEVAIAVTRDGARTVELPNRYAVHLVPIDRTEPCWRCDRLAST